MCSFQLFSSAIKNKFPYKLKIQLGKRIMKIKEIYFGTFYFHVQRFFCYLILHN